MTSEPELLGFSVVVDPFHNGPPEFRRDAYVWLDSVGDYREVVAAPPAPVYVHSVIDAGTQGLIRGRTNATLRRAGVSRPAWHLNPEESPPRPSAFFGPSVALFWGAEDQGDWPTETDVDFGFVSTSADAMVMDFELQATAVCWKKVVGVECGEPSDPESETGLCAEHRGEIRQRYAR